MSMISSLPIRVRFFFLLLPTLATGRCSVTRLVAYAFELNARGNNRLGTWCWKRVLRVCAIDGAMYETALKFCLGAGKYSAASELANGFYDANGLRPKAGIKLVGDLVLSASYESAINIYDRILKEFGDDAVQRSPAPEWSCRLDGHDLRALLTSHIAGVRTDVADDDTTLGFARLCFSFGVFDTSAKLFEKSRAQNALGAREQIAEAYSLLQGNGVRRKSLTVDPISETLDPDWLILRASVLIANGDALRAAADVDEALRIRYQGHIDLDKMITDCKDIISVLVQFPAMIELNTSTLAFSVKDRESRLRKIFVCGNGWTGSGAIYDALTEYDHLAEIPEAPRSRFLNDDTGNEMMFIQGPSGLGQIWRTARQEQTLRRLDLLELFRCHVLGAGSIGYTEQKCNRAASQLMGLLGPHYTGIFRSMFEAFSMLGDEADLPTMHQILNAAAESLTAAFAGDHACVVFNNAVFGRNLDMLAIFHNFRVAVAVRDPLDTYADRKAHDLKHWMTATRFVHFYRDSRQAIQTSQNQLAPNQADTIREVEFESFVLDKSYRSTVINWLLEGLQASRIRRRFEPAKSALNVGLHKQRLSVSECAAIEMELGKWRRG